MHENILFRIWAVLTQRGLLKWIPDKAHCRITYWLRVGKKLNLENPTFYAEKLQWLKLYYHNPLLTEMADKYTARNYIKRTIGDEYLVPLIGVWDGVDDVEVDSLPNSFVIKSSNDSGGLCVCTDKSKFNWEMVREQLRKTVSTNYFYSYREWPYKNGKPKIIAEEVLEDKKTGYLKDYKFLCFNGVVKLLYVTSNRGLGGGLRMDYFDPDWNHLDISHFKYPQNKDSVPEKPKNFDKMILIAEKLSSGLPHVRVDLYNIDGKIYAGELTFYQDAGYATMKPDKWNLQFGEWLTLPEKML